MNNEITIYLISGLGADKRAFQKLSFPEKYFVKNIEWVSPLKNESLCDYTKRLSEQIDSSGQFILIGLSFGGIIVSELTKFIKPYKAIIISSVQNRKEIPWYLRFLGKIKIHKIISSRLLIKPNKFLFWLFGSNNTEQKELLSKILKDTDPLFMKWAINALVSWNNRSNHCVIFHIHGTKDKMLPVRFVKPDVRIEGGGHFMVYSKAEELNVILKEELLN